MLDPQPAGRGRRCRTRRCRRRRRCPARSSPGSGRPGRRCRSRARRCSREHDVRDARRRRSRRSRSRRSRPDFVTTRSTRSSEPSKRSSSCEPCTCTPCSVERVLEEAADLGPAHALVRHRLEHDQLALLAERRERGRQLGADVAAADQRDALRPLELGRAARPSCAACAGSGSRRAARPRRAGCARWSPSRAAPCRSATSSLLESVATRASTSSAVTLVRVSSSTSLLARTSRRAGPRMSSRDSSPRRYPFVSGGAVVGRVELAPDQQDLALGSLLAQVARAVRGREAAADQQVLDPSAQPRPRNRFRSPPRSRSPRSSWRKCAAPSITRSSPAPRDQRRRTAGPAFGREDRVGVGEADERGLVPAAPARSRDLRSSPPRPASSGVSRHEQREQLRRPPSTRRSATAPRRRRRPPAGRRSWSPPLMMKPIGRSGLRSAKLRQAMNASCSPGR